MNPILQCYPASQAAIVAMVGVYSEQARAERSFFTPVTAEDLPEDYGHKKERKRSRNYKTIQLENEIIKLLEGGEKTLSRIERTLNKGYHTVKKTINGLCETGVLKSREQGLRAGKPNIYYRIGLGAGEAQNELSLVFEAVTLDGIGVYELTRKTKLHRNIVNKELEALIKSGKVQEFSSVAPNNVVVKRYKKVMLVKRNRTLAGVRS